MCTSTTVFVSYHFHLFHVSPHHEYSFLLQIFVGYCLRHIFFPGPPSTRDIEAGSIDGPADRAVLCPSCRPSHNCGNRSRPVVWSSSIIGIFGHDHHSGRACGIGDDNDGWDAAPWTVPQAFLLVIRRLVGWGRHTRLW